MNSIELETVADSKLNRNYLVPLKERPVPLKPDFYNDVLGRKERISLEDIFATKKDIHTPKGLNLKTSQPPREKETCKGNLTAIDFDETKFLQDEEKKRRRSTGNSSGILKR
uniref:Uncharacterized protein n=1 Tax=Rhabditophanes sp. KR3021 TaxID=114890 RepID=A0AC35UC81_9BILA